MRLWIASLFALLVSTSCLAPECAHGSYFSAECRVAAENHYARLVTQTGVELRFADPMAPGPGWDAVGLFEEEADGTVVARPSGLADFTFSLDASRLDATTEVSIRLINVAPDVVVAIDGADLAPPDPPLLTRSLTLTVPPSTPVTVSGVRPCPDAFRIAATGDIQTNPVQFERIVQALHDEVAASSTAGEPLLGLLLLGDLTENATEDEFTRIREILSSSPVPVATTVGNHDVIGEELAIYNRRFGPGNHAFDLCKARVALVDSGNGDLAPSIEGRLSTLLDPGDRPFFVAGTHYPPYPGRTGAGFADDGQAMVLLGELVRQNADLLVTGHVHTWRAFDDLRIGEGTLDQVITGTAGGGQGTAQPHFGFTRITITDALEFCFVEVPEPGRAPGDGGTGERRLRRCAEP